MDGWTHEGRMDELIRQRDEARAALKEIVEKGTGPHSYAQAAKVTGPKWAVEIAKRGLKESESR
jgi:hypothetical protein